MTRVQLVLAGLAAVLLIVLYWLLLWSPQQDELDAVRVDIEAAQQEQDRLSLELEQLRAVRSEAPQVEAELSAARAVVPTDPGLPATLRQLQSAADESGATLLAISPSRPEQIEDAEQGVSAIGVNVQLVGGYFQVVDFLRRVEDPSITPRGLVWGDLGVSRDEYPALTVSLSGTMFTHLPAPPDAEPAEEPEPDEDDADSDEADVTVEVEEDDE